MYPPAPTGKKAPGAWSTSSSPAPGQCNNPNSRLPNGRRQKLGGKFGREPPCTERNCRSAILKPVVRTVKFLITASSPQGFRKGLNTVSGLWSDHGLPGK